MNLTLYSQKEMISVDSCFTQVYSIFFENYRILSIAYGFLFGMILFKVFRECKSFDEVKTQFKKWWSVLLIASVILAYNTYRLFGFSQIQKSLLGM